jgi:hypothetical protein
MIDKDARVVAETVFEREKRREREVGDALKLEEERHAAVIENMRRLRALRLSSEDGSELLWREVIMTLFVKASFVQRSLWPSN